MGRGGGSSNHALGKFAPVIVVIVLLAIVTVNPWSQDRLQSLWSDVISQED